MADDDATEDELIDKFDASFNKQMAELFGEDGLKRPAIDMGYYILDAQHNPVHITGTIRWGRWMETHLAERIVAQEQFPPYRVSTVFLGLDHGFQRMLHAAGEPPPPGYRPLLFETMVFVLVGTEQQLSIMERCCTWDEAVIQHARIVRDIRQAAQN